MFDSPQVCEENIKSIGISSSIEGILIRKKKDLETRLADVNAALDAMSANPEIVKVLELVNKAR